MSVSNLNNTKWVIKDTPTFTSYQQGSSQYFNINFKSNNIDFTTMVIGWNDSFSDYEGRQIAYGNNLITPSTYHGETPTGWTNQAYRIIEITGGTDVTNASLIAWLEANATQVNVTDLTGTKWVMNNTLQIDDDYYFDLLFTSNQENFIEFNPNYWNHDEPELIWRSELDYIWAYDSGTWTNQAYRLISITDGNDVSNPDLLVWLNNNATLVPVVDLTDTTWVLPSGLVDMGIFMHSDITKPAEIPNWVDAWTLLSFVSNGSSFTSIISGDTGENEITYYNSNDTSLSVDVQDLNGWLVSDAYKTISISNGTDIANPDLIVWLTENATLLVTTDLTGWTWVGNNSLDLGGYDGGTPQFDLHFVCNNVNYDFFEIDGDEKYDNFNGLYYDNNQRTLIYNFNTNQWSNSAYKTIQITGGTDATALHFIKWLQENGTLTAPQPTPVKTFDLSTLQLSAGTHTIQVKARATGYRDSNFSNSVSYIVSPSRVTDLTGTTWRLPSGMIDMDILVHGTGIYDRYNSINFTSNGQSFIGMSSPDTAENGLYYDASNSANSVYVQPAGVWNVSDAYKTIHITGGTDATNQDLIDWLYDNATLVTGYEVTISITNEDYYYMYHEFKIYDGQDSLGTLLFESSDTNNGTPTPITVFCSSGNLYISLYGSSPYATNITTTGGVTGDSSGYNLSYTVTGNGTITIGSLDWD